MTAALAGDALAGRNDLKLVNLCPQAASQECTWVERDASGAVTGVSIDSGGKSRFRSLMSELGVVLAPRIPMPAGSLGFAGFLVTGEMGITQISRNQDYWDGVRAVAPQTPNLGRPDSVLTTLGVFLRKGIWLPVPALELGGGVVNLLDSQMLSWQAYSKFALHEGFHNLPIPSLSVRGAFAYLTGTDQANLGTLSLDVLVSKGFGVLKTARIEPFGGWSLLLITASGKTIDFTPLSDTDWQANTAFPGQEVITRHRVFGGAKLKFGLLAVIAQYELYLAGHSRDESVVSAVDRSGKQSAFSLSLGLEF
ncbi:MAG: hypothetical protein JXP73_20735 [Deltaproteobacteria bacterium]|nr:hypothetical protein [Deltaproteobacteria bacterium]